ncbi:hypothetical protein, partial [Xanthomonas oryzae]|uniref:hypothetical protein n=1 Tax=Xanthomonas oryzae TaxID=347 RepID=UPI001C4B5EEB
MAGHNPVSPTMVVTRKTAFSPGATAIFCGILVIVRSRQVAHYGNIGTPPVQRRRIGRFQRDVGAPSHGDAD